MFQVLHKLTIFTNLEENKTFNLTIKRSYYTVILPSSTWQDGFENLIWACGGMVDTLVLGTSANAWEFESLHAHHF